MMPASAASTAPRSEVSSQGCTTMVVAGRHVPCRAQSAARICRAATVASASCSDGHDAPLCNVVRQEASRLHDACGRSSAVRAGISTAWTSAGPNRTAARRAHALGRPRRRSRRARSAPRGSRQAPCAAPRRRRQQRWDGRERRLLVDQQHEELLAHQRLEFRQRQPRGLASLARRMRRIASKPRSSDDAARHADIEQRRAPALRAGRPSPMRDFSSAIRVLAATALCSGLLAALRGGAPCPGSMPTAACSAGEP